MTEGRSPSRSPEEDEAMSDICGGAYKVTVEDGTYEVRCEKCGAVTAAGPATDRHFFEQFYAKQTCERVVRNG